MRHICKQWVMVPGCLWQYKTLFISVLTTGPDVSGNWNSYSQKIRTRLFCISSHCINIVRPVYSGFSTWGDTFVFDVDWYLWHGYMFTWWHLTKYPDELTPCALVTSFWCLSTWSLNHICLSLSSCKACVVYISVRKYIRSCEFILYTQFKKCKTRRTLIINR